MDTGGWGKKAAGGSPTLVFEVLIGGQGVGAQPPPMVLVAGQVGEGGPGKRWGNFPGGPVLPRLAPSVVTTLSAVVVVTLSENSGAVVGADHAVAVGLADLDALVG